MSTHRIPIGLKILLGLWLAVWIPIYWIGHGPANFLWFCDLANILIAIAIWIESPLLLSSQAVGVLLIQILWTIDALGRWVLGTHLIGGTEYMFDEATPLTLRLVSLFHVATPPLLIWGLSRLGYDRRGLRLQSVLAVAVMPISWLVGQERNLNWTWSPFGLDQTLLPPLIYLPVAIVALILVVYVPTHLVLRRLFRSADRSYRSA